MLGQDVSSFGIVPRLMSTKNRCGSCCSVERITLLQGRERRGRLLGDGQEDLPEHPGREVGEFVPPFFLRFFPSRKSGLTFGGFQLGLERGGYGRAAEAIATQLGGGRERWPEAVQLLMHLLSARTPYCANHSLFTLSVGLCA